MRANSRFVTLVAPYAAWMALMSLLPLTAWAYATRGAVTAALLVPCAVRGLGARASAAARLRAVAWGLLVGILVFGVWIAPESWLWPEDTGREASPYAPEACGWGLTCAKFAASAFVISAAEELFFRKWLVEFAGFGWMLLLFGIEHMRWDLGPVRGCVFIAEGVFAGLCYGILAKRCGLAAAIVAHAVTNLVLGLYVIFFDKWFYW